MTNNAIIKDISPTPDAAVIWMHGLGADGNDFLPIVDELGLTNLALRFVFPHAPLMPVTINMGMRMPAWYDIRYQQLNRDEDREGIERSKKRIDAIIESLNQQGIASQRIVLAGFSQGGVMALFCGLRHEKPLAGIMALSCYLALADSSKAEATAANKHTPIFMAQGIYDPVVPYATAVNARETLSDLGYSVEWHEYPMQHSVCIEEIRSIGTWLKKVIQPIRAGDPE